MQISTALRVSINVLGAALCGGKGCQSIFAVSLLFTASYGEQVPLSKPQIQRQVLSEIRSQESSRSLPRQRSFLYMQDAFWP